MKKLVIATMIALFIGSGAGGIMSASAMTASDVVQQATTNAITPFGSLDSSSRLSAGVQSAIMDSSDRNMGCVYVNPQYGSDKRGPKIHVDVYRRYVHSYIKGDKKKLGLPEYDSLTFEKINYGARPDITYDVPETAMSTDGTSIGHNAHRFFDFKTNQEMWVFRIGNSDRYYALEPNGGVGRFRSTVALPF